MILTFMKDTLKTDFKVNEKDKIIDVLRTINDNTQMHCNLKEIAYIYSFRLQEQIDVKDTFIDAKIYNGDILEIRGYRDE